MMDGDDGPKVIDTLTAGKPADPIAGIVKFLFDAAQLFSSGSDLSSA